MRRLKEMAVYEWGIVTVALAVIGFGLWVLTATPHEPWRGLAYALIAIGILGALLAFVAYPLFVRVAIAGTEAAIAHGIKLPAASIAVETTADDALALLQAVEFELSHNAEVLEASLERGFYSVNPGFWPGEWNRARFTMGRRAELVAMCRTVEKAYASMRRIHDLAINASPNQVVDDAEILGRALDEIWAARDLVTDAVDARAKLEIDA